MVTDGEPITPPHTNVDPSSPAAAPIEPYPMYEEFAASAREWADSGRVCIGPAGKPVSERDRRIYAMLTHVEPTGVGNWFEACCQHQFFTMKPRVTRSNTDDALYVVYRGARTGPGFYASWAEVRPAVVGVAGALYQRCKSWADATLRFVQALAIGGVVCQIPDEALTAADVAAWMLALQSAPAPPVHVSTGMMPPPLADAVLTEAGEPMAWRTFDVGRSLTYVPSELHFQPLAPQPLPTLRRRASNVSRQRPSWRLSTDGRHARAVDLNAAGTGTGGRALNGYLGIGVTGTGAAQAVDVSDDEDEELCFYMVKHGGCPWLYDSFLAMAAMTVARPTYWEAYSSFDDALVAFQNAIQDRELCVKVLGTK
ncbi:hypothetical protein BN946_scf184348.g2 [Trametes cinnabarina]|uniref:Ribonuclease H1 N-terminal domain-containing protein n=1 Tax=Pycnoporus cinnabarinus TaxID=5643 RepID=A0A060SIM7_PYCCI|nr:hypothetical protein BN946_scf184348.g2 [Trametes cinnabarina]